MKVGAISLGCDKNRVDTENLLGFVTEAGHTIVNDINEAELVLINSCAFLQSAIKESLEAIWDAKAHANVEYVVLTGCLPMRYLTEITGEDGLTEVNAFVPNTCYEKIGEVIERVKHGERVVLEKDDSLPKSSANRVVTTPYHYAYLKVAEGCNNRCTFCAIPSIRGAYRSESPESVLSEARSLADQGVKELILVAQDVTRYGSDLTPPVSLVSLLRSLITLPIERIRLLYCYPDACTKELIDLIDEEPKIAKYIDMPMQHASDAVLKRMNRKDTAQSLKEKIAYIRSKNSNIAIRSTFMVGFPGETEEDFEQLCDFLREERLENVGFFAYSKEDGTPASKLKDQVSQRIKAKRLSVVSAIQSLIQTELAQAKIGKMIDVVYDGIDYDKQLFYGHTERTMPDGDGKVFFSSNVPVEIGEIYRVRVDKVKKLDLYGKVAEEQA